MYHHHHQSSRERESYTQTTIHKGVECRTERVVLSTAVCRDGGFNLEGCETRIIMRWATLLLLLASWRTRISSAPLPPPPPKDAAIAAAAISDAFALFAYNVSGAGSLDCNGLYLPESFFQWSKTPSLALVYPTTFSDAGPWNAGSTLSRQTHGASSYWIVSSPRSRYRTRRYRRTTPSANSITGNSSASIPKYVNIDTSSETSRALS